MPIENNDEDTIIANAFTKIKSGLLASDWSLISDAYFDISGERIAVATTKNRLEKIRDLIGVEDTIITPEKPPQGKKKGKVKKDATGEEIISDSDFKIQKGKGGKNFAKDGFQIIETVINEEEKRRNEEIEKKTIKSPPVLRTKVPPQNKDSEASVRSGEPTTPPPWKH